MILIVNSKLSLFTLLLGSSVMKNLIVAMCTLVMGTGIAAMAQEAGPASKPPATSPAFDSLKKLVGEWTATGPDGKSMETKFRLTAGGSVLVETLFPGKPEEMVTMYHMDGPDLILTHYCMLGNQPRLKAASVAETKKLSFKSVGGTNMKLADMHMGQAEFTLVDNDHFVADWCSCTGGKPDESHHVNIKFARKK